MPYQFGTRNLAFAFKRILVLALALFVSSCGLAHAEQPPANKLIGIYVHQHWPYNHPFCARTWTLNDWTGYIDGMKRLGFNTIKIWPVLETMPKPLTASDDAHLKKMEKVIDLAHDQGMRVIIALCPNVIADSAVAKQTTFEERHFFYCDLRVNPGDETELQRMLAWRETLMRPISKADAIAIIDSDPGGYPGSNNEEFVHLLVEHRKMFDRLRPRIELLYWVHAGWPAYCRYYETGKFEFGKEPDFLDALHRIVLANPEPWGLAGNIAWAKKANLAPRAIEYRYGAIEGEPSFPLTNFGGDLAYKAAQETSGRGVMGNAQSHCLQIPNTFAFARGALGLPVDDAAYTRFAEDLIPGHGSEIVQGWTALRSGTPEHKRTLAASLEKLAETDLKTGPLKGLLFGDPQRFVIDIVMQLRLHAACDEFCQASESGEPVATKFREFARAFAAWQKRVGYQGRVAWNWRRLDAALDKLASPEINAARHPHPTASVPFAKVKEEYALAETATSRLTEAMSHLAEKMVNH